MQLMLVIRTLGVLLMLFSLSLAPTLVVSAIYQDGKVFHFSSTMGLSLVAGWLLWAPLRRLHLPLRARDGFVVVTMFWVVMSLLSALPFMFGLEMGAADAVFESVSGFTTTGATVIVGLDRLPPSILFFRQILQWFGGIGVIVSAVALLPMMGVGGMQLFRAETPGPMKDEKLTPRIAHTARTLWQIYALFTVICAAGFWLGGMSVFDAIGHAFSTVSTGGFSTHDASMAYFNSPFIEAVAVVFMTLGGINFGIHYLAMRGVDPALYWRSPETRAYLLLLAALTLLVGVLLTVSGAYSDVVSSLRYAVFEVVSVVTGTGFGVADFSAWPLALPVILIFSSFTGGCAGSTTGGMKVVRLLLLWKQGWLEIQRLVHPRMVRPLKLGERTVSSRVAESVWAFFAVYIASFAVIMILLMFTGLDQVTAFSAVAACMNNLGPGLGQVAVNFTAVNDFGLWLLSFAMMLGRLEIFTILVLLTPAFWRQ